MVRRLKGIILLFLVSVLAQPAQAVSSILTNNSFHSLKDPVKLTEMSDFFIRFKGMIRIVMIIALLTTIVSFAISLTRLSASGGNEQLRAKALKGLLFSGIGIILFGGASVILGLAFGLFR